MFRLLKKITEISNVIIVTNALPIWIKISSSVLPKTQYILKKIKIISAKKNFQKISNDATEWKRLAFKSEVIDKKNIISIGDASYEYKALISLYNEKRILKSMKFLENPTHEILKEQIEILIDNIYEMVTYQKHLDLIFKSR